MDTYQIITIAVIVLSNIVALVIAFQKTKSKVDNIDRNLNDEIKDRKDDIKSIEEKRLTNVNFLREIYDEKVEDSKKYAKGLFELREGELKEISKRLSSLEGKYDGQTEMIHKNFMSIQKSLAVIEAHINACPIMTPKK